MTESMKSIERTLNVPPAAPKSDEELADAVRTALLWHFWIPKNAIHPEVHEGWVTLSGSIDWLFQRNAIEGVVRKVSGVRGITDDIRVECRPVSTHRSSHCVAKLDLDKHQKV